MRRYYLDNLRWITVLLVVFYHVIYIFNGIVPELVVGPFHPVQLQDAVQYLLYPWFMVLLFVVAGVSARLALEKYSPGEFLRSRTRRLLVPSTVGLLAFQWIGGWVNMEVAGGFDQMSAEIPVLIRWPILALSGTGVLWFIQMLWIFSVLLLPIRRLEKGRLEVRCGRCPVWGLVLLAVPLWLSAKVGNTPVICVYRFGIYGFSFLLGYFLFSHEQVIGRLSRCWLPLAVAALITGVGYAWYYFGENYAEAPVVNSLFSIAYGWIVVLAAFAVMKRFGDRTSPFAEWMGSRSFGLYVFHYMPMSAAALWICRANDMQAFWSYLITGAAAILGGYALNALISRIPVLRWCVLGIRKRGKNHVS